MPVKTLRVAAYYGIKVAKNSSAQYLKPSEFGCSLVDLAGNWQIIYDDTEPKGRMRFTIAHELGHILLGHEMSDGFGHFRTASDKRPAAERQADEFAARLLAPACVLWALEAYTPEDIAALCDISYTAAQFRAERMKILRERGKFLTSPLERQVFEQFDDFVKKQKSRPS